MFRRSRSTDEPPQVEQLPAPVDDGALDTIAAVLRALAHAEEDGRRRADLETWARHVLVLAPPPGGGDEPPSERQWPAVRRVAVSAIGDDAAEREEALGNLRDVVWTMVDRVGNALAHETRENRTTFDALDALRVAATGDPADLRKAALEAVTVLGTILDERQTRQSSLASALGDRIKTLSTELDQARREAELDPLTQLANRGVLDRELARIVAIRALVDEPVSIALVDVDRLKGINDTYGHLGGDAALRYVGRELARAFPRKSDLAARFGGDEFAVILRHATPEDAGRLAGNLGARLRDNPINVRGADITVTVSVGVAEIVPGHTAEESIAVADRALYAAKNGGRDRVVLSGDAEALEAAA